MVLNLFILNSFMFLPHRACLKNTGPFNNLQADDYWSGTEYSLHPYYAWFFGFNDGFQGRDGKYQFDWLALAVRPGEVSAVPVPATVFLLASGLLGLVGLRRRVRK